MTTRMSVPESTKAVIRRGRHPGPLVRNAVALAISQAAAAGFGLFFWILAARLASEEAVGRDGTLILVMTTVSGIAQMNYGLALPRLVPAARSPLALIRGAYVRTGLAALAIGTVVILGLSVTVDTFQFVRTAAWLIPLFVVGVGSWTWFTVQDACLAGFGRSPTVAFENIVFGVIKLALVGVLATVLHGIFLAWVLSTAVVVLVTSRYVFRIAKRSHINEHGRPDQEAHGPLRFRTFDVLGMLCLLIATAFLPITVIGSLGATEAAFFSIAVSIAWSLDGMAIAVATSFTVEAARDEAAISHHLQRAIRVFLPLVLVGTVATIVLAELLLWPFGASYQDGAATTLRLLLLALPVRFLGALLVSVSRVRFNGPAMLVSQGAVLVVALPTALILMQSFGLPGAGAGWLLGQTASLVAAYWYWREGAPPAAVEVELGDDPGAARPSAVPADVLDLRDRLRSGATRQPWC